MKLTIVSGGQTGADRGGFDAAIELGLAFGGWAPSGFKAEDGTIPPIYAGQMRESTSPEYGLRTRLNVQDSDATLLVSFAAELTGGSLFTAKQCRAQRKLARHLVLPQGRGRVPVDVRGSLLEWLRENHIEVLNVAGPRESKEPGVQLAVKQALVWILSEVAAEELREFADGPLRLLEALVDSDAPQRTFAPPTPQGDPTP